MSIKKQAVSGIFWTFAQQFSDQIITFIVSLVLARLLLPAEFGLIGMISVFYSIGRILIDSGLSQSLIRAEAVDEEEYSTVFFFNFLFSLFIYLILFSIAPFIAHFYNQSQLTNIIRVYSIILVINSLSSIQFTRLTKLMRFKTQMIIIIPSLIIASIIGVIMAYNGFGVWSLIYTEVIKASLITIQVFIYSKWLPKFSFNFMKLKKYLGYGMNMTISYVIDVFFKNIYTIFIGKYYSPTTLGYYSRADLLKQLPVSNVVFALNKVTFPVFASIQNDTLKLKNAYKKIMLMITFIIAPLLIFMVVLAEPIIVFLFSDKWLPCIPYFQILAFVGILHPVQSYNLNILLVKGNSRLYLHLEILKKAIILVSVLFTYRYGVVVLISGQIILSLLFFVINSYFAGKLIYYSTREQIKDLFPIIFYAFFSGLVLFCFNNFISSFDFTNFTKIFLGFLVGSVVYLTPFFIFKNYIINEIFNLIQTYR